MKNDKLNFTRLNKLFQLLAKQTDGKVVEKIMLDLCTPAELEAMADRLHVLPLIAKGDSYRKIHEKTGVSITTIGRVARQRHIGHGGYAALYPEEKK